MGTNFERWLSTYERRRSPGWMRRRRVTEMRLSPRKARSHKAARLIREQRYQNAATAGTERHVRAVQKDGDNGLRCPDCHTIPLKPWEPVQTDWPCSCDPGLPENAGCIFR